MAMTDEEKHSIEAAKASKTWRALRAATRTRLDLLDKVEPGKSLEDVLNPPAPPQEPVSDGAEGGGVEGKVDEVAT